MLVIVRQMGNASQDDRTRSHFGAAESSPECRAPAWSRPLPGPGGRRQTWRATGQIPCAPGPNAGRALAGVFDLNARGSVRVRGVRHRSQHFIAASESVRAKEKGPHFGSSSIQRDDVCAYTSARRRIKPKPNMENRAMPMRASVEGSGTSTSSVSMIRTGRCEGSTARELAN